MSDEKRKQEPPLYLDMGFEEALTRYARTDPSEVEPPAGKKRKVPKVTKKLAGLGSSKRPQRPQEKRGHK